MKGARRATAAPARPVQLVPPLPKHDLGQGKVYFLEKLPALIKDARIRWVPPETARSTSNQFARLTKIDSLLASLKVLVALQFLLKGTSI